MILWTIQNQAAYERMLETGKLIANRKYSFSNEGFQHAYDWIACKMIEQGIAKPKELQHPVWAWYQWEGKRKRRDLRKRGYGTKGEKMVQITFEVDSQNVLLSDFDLFHYVLNYWYLPSDEVDDLEFEREYTEEGFTFLDLNNFQIQGQSIERIRHRIIKSWDCIFDLEKEDDGWLYGKKESKSIQATMWEMSLEQIRKVEFFVAR